jgi:hypothetical protein
LGCSQKIEEELPGGVSGLDGPEALYYAVEDHRQLVIELMRGCYRDGAHPVGFGASIHTAH